MTHGVFHDFEHLVITTDTPVAAHAYSRGIQLLIASSADAEALLRDAVAADPNFALARVALDLAVDAGDGAADGRGGADRPDSTFTRATRRERQHIEVIRLLLDGERDRAAVLGREHLREFPNDVLVSHVLASRGLT